MLYSGMSVRLSITEITVVSYKDVNKHGFARLGNKNKCFVGFIHMNAALISDYSLWVQVFHNKYGGYSFVCKAYSIDHLSVIALCCLNIYFSRTFFFLLSLPHRCLCFYLVLFCKPDTGALETSSGKKKKATISCTIKGLHLVCFYLRKRKKTHSVPSFHKKRASAQHARVWGILGHAFLSQFFCHMWSKWLLWMMSCLRLSSWWAYKVRLPSLISYRVLVIEFWWEWLFVPWINCWESLIPCAPFILTVHLSLLVQVLFPVV